MMRRLLPTLAALATAMLVPFWAAASTPDLVRPLSEAELEIQDAASVPEAEERELRLQNAIHKGLFDSDEATQKFVFEYLWSNNRWIDLAPFAAILKEYDAKTNRHKGAWLLDINQIFRKNRLERLAIYSKAIENGEIVLENGRPWLRSQAIRATALDGLVELKPLAESNFDSIPDALKKGFSLAEFQSTLELCAGGDDQESAATLAAERLEKIGDEDFSHMMRSDPVFQRVVMRICDYVCAENPFTGVQNPGCRTVFRIYARQIKYIIDKSGEQKAQSVEGESSEGTESGSADDSWLATIGSLTLDGEKFEHRDLKN